MKTYNIDKQFFNDIFFKIREDERKNRKRFVLLYGGSGGGKSVIATQISIIRALEKVGTTLIVRKFASSLNKSCVALFHDILDEWNIPFTYNKNEKVLTLQNGSKFYFLGIDKPEKLKSIFGISWVYIEEADQINDEDFKQINLRIRGSSAKNCVITLVFNPTNKRSFIYKDWFEKIRNDSYIYKVTYLDNKFIDIEYAEQLEALKPIDEYHYNCYCLGEWGHLKTGQEVYKFDYLKNLELQKKYEYDPEQPLFLSWDDNTMPWCALLLIQSFTNEKGEKVMVVVDEICEEGKNVEDVCLFFASKYSLHANAIIITGDKTSDKKNTLLDHGQNFFTLIMNYLSEFHPKLNLLSRNENVYLSAMFANKLFVENKIIIKDHCKKTIEDVQNVKFDQSGTGKDKKYIVRKNSDGTVSRFQQYGHNSDSLSYCLCVLFNEDLNTFKYKTKSFTILGGQERQNFNY